MPKIIHVVLFLVMAISLLGCSDELLEDPSTQLEIPTVKTEAGNLVQRFQIDGMVGYGDYSREELVIDTSYYKSHKLQRGDVVYVHNPQNPNLILRVVGLEGENVEIRTGEVYINDKKLNSFYGKPPGPGLEELKKQESALAAGYEKTNFQNRIKNYEKNNLKMKVPKSSAFLLGDNRWRAIDSESLGPIPLDNIQGKVMGYLEKHTFDISPTFVLDDKENLFVRGEKGRLAIVEKPLVAGKPYQDYWFFWGKPEELNGNVEIVAVRQNNDSTRTVVFAAGGVSGPLKGADGHIPPSNMTIPLPGLWRLEAYIGGKYFGSTVIEVKS